MRSEKLAAGMHSRILTPAASLLLVASFSRPPAVLEVPPSGIHVGEVVAVAVVEVVLIQLGVVVAVGTSMKVVLRMAVGVLLYSRRQFSAPQYIRHWLTLFARERVKVK